MDLLGGIGRGGIVEAGPAGFAIARAAALRVDRAVALEHRFGLAHQIVGHLGADQRTAAADAFGIDVRVILVMPCVLERADDAARRRAAGRAGIGAAGGAATGSIVGALKNAGHDENDAHVYAEGVRRGGSLVSAKVPDELVSEAEAVLERNRSVDAQSRGASYRESGWTSFDDTAPAYTADEVHEERARYTTGSRL